MENNNTDRPSYLKRACLLHQIALLDAFLENTENGFL
jgi:hypothetical protein